MAKYKTAAEQDLLVGWEVPDITLEELAFTAFAVPKLMETAMVTVQGETEQGTSRDIRAIVGLGTALIYAGICMAKESGATDIIVRATKKEDA